MKKLTILSTVALLGACAYTSQPAGMGGLVTQTKAPVMATSNSGASKTGTACAENFLGLVVMGDASVEAAKKDAKITNVSSVSLDNFGVLGLYAKSCTVVTGN